MSPSHLITEPIPKLLKELAVPASTGIIFNTFYNVVDTFYAGLLSTEAVAALSMSFFLYFLIVGVGFGFGSAVTALIGNAQGERNPLLASLYARKGIGFVILLGIITGSFGLLFANDLLLVAGTDSHYLPLALEYIHVVLFAAPLFMATYGLNAILVARGDTKSYRNMLIAGFFLNLVLNPLFIYGAGIIPSFGIAGIALATVLIQCVSVVVLGYKVMHCGIFEKDDKTLQMPDWLVYKNIFFQGLPPSMNMLTMSLGSVLTIYFVSSYGFKAVAGYGIAFRVEQIMLLPALGISSAVLSLVSNNFGAGKIERVYETVKLALMYGASICVVGIVLGYSVGEWVVARFDADAEVITYAMTYLYIEVFIFFGYVILFICVSTLQGIKLPKVIFYVGVYRQIVAKIILFSIIVLWFKWPYVTIWYGFFFIVYSAAIFMGWYTYNALHVRLHKSTQSGAMV